ARRAPRREGRCPAEPRRGVPEARPAGGLRLRQRPVLAARVHTGGARQADCPPSGRFERLDPIQNPLESDPPFRRGEESMKKPLAPVGLSLGPFASAGASVAYAQHAAEPAPAPKPPALLSGLGTHRHPIATASPEAQKFFDQGMVMLFGFNHEEAFRSFEKA